MNLIKIFKITFFYLLLTYSFIVKSEQVTMYLDMNYVLQNSQAGKSISDKLININSKNVNEFKLIEKKIEEDKKKLSNGCRYQKMLVYKVVTFLKRIKMAVLFLIFLDQIRPKWIKLDQTWSNWISQQSKNVTIKSCHIYKRD